MVDENRLPLIRDLRRKTSEADSSTFSDDDLNDILLQAEDDVRAAAAEVWELKAASVAMLIDTSESGSSRSASQMHKAALTMAKQYRADPETGEEPIADVVAPRTRPVTRR